MQPKWINAISGVPIARDFDITRFQGTPLVIDTPTGALYYINNGTVSEVKPTNLGAFYRTIFEVSGSHTAGKVAGTYGLPRESALIVSGTGSAYPLGIIAFRAADYPTVNGLAPKLRVCANLHVNDVAPTGNFTFGLYPVTRPAVSGGAGVCTYTLGALIAGSDCPVITAPAVDSSNTVVGTDFALPADGYYCIGVVTTATVAANAHIHANAYLQQRNA